MLLLYEFKRHASASDAARNICDAIGPSSVSYDTSKVWFHTFKNGGFDLEGQPWSERPVTVYEERLLDLVQEDPQRSTRGLKDELKCRHTTLPLLS